MRHRRIACGRSIAAVLLLIAAGAAADTPYLSEVERAVVLEINKLRADPLQWAAMNLEPRLKYFRGRLYQAPGQPNIQTNEGVDAVREAIRVLRSMPPRQPMEPSPGLSRAARDHVEDTGPRGVLGHTGTDGSTLGDRVERYGQWDITLGENISYGYRDAVEIVVQLVVDDGVPSRGHRENLLNQQFARIGVAVGEHSVYGSVCVLDFAGVFDESGR